VPSADTIAQRSDQLVGVSRAGVLLKPGDRLAQTSALPLQTGDERLERERDLDVATTASGPKPSGMRRELAALDIFGFGGELLEARMLAQVQEQVSASRS